MKTGLLWNVPIRLTFCISVLNFTEQRNIPFEVLYLDLYFVTNKVWNISLLTVWLIRMIAKRKPILMFNSIWFVFLLLDKVLLMSRETALEWISWLKRVNCISGRANLFISLSVLYQRKAAGNGKYFITVPKLLIRTLLRNNGFCKQNEKNLWLKRAIQSS